MTEEERLQWESEKYARTAQVLALDSGRFVVAHGLEVHKVVDAAELSPAIREVYNLFIDDYVPPKSRFSAKRALLSVIEPPPLKSLIDVDLGL